MHSIHCINVLLVILTTLVIGQLYAQFPTDIEDKAEAEQNVEDHNNMYNNGDYEVNTINGTTEYLMENMTPFPESRNSEDFDNYNRIIYFYCSQTYPITDVMIADAIKGNISEERNFKCYLMCAFRKLELICPHAKSITIDEYSLISLFEERFNGTIKNIIKKCLPITNENDGCEIVYKYIKCSLKIDKRSVAFIPISSRIKTNEKQSVPPFMSDVSKDGKTSLVT